MDEQYDADHPIELLGALVCASVEDPRHVGRHRKDHEMGRPAMHVADVLAERHLGLDRLDVGVRLTGLGT